MGRSFTRTPQACDPCRRRKTKCDGVRPRCNRCARRNASCVWSHPDLPHGVGPTEPSTPSSEVSVTVEDGEPRRKGLKLCVERFFERHFASDFCSFDHRPDFEQKCHRDPLLAAAVIALCGRYLEAYDAQACFGLSSGPEISRNRLNEARTLAKASLDQPSVSNIQGNLILAQAELLSNSGSRHWLFAGTAIRMAEVMRLNKDFHQKHSPKDQEIRRRTFWACLLFDRALAYFLAKHRAVDLDNVDIPVPDSDLALVYQEGTRGVTLDDLASYPRPSDLGLSPYLIKTVCLWGSLADFAVYSRRRLDKFPPIDPRSVLFRRHNALQTWVDSLHPSLCWNLDIFKTHCTLGQGRSFVALHFLLCSSGCVAHQCYLPHLAMYTQLVDLVDAAGWSYLHRDPSLIDICVSNALKLGEMLSSLMDPELESGRSSLHTIWVASSMLIAANTFLWLRYAQDEAYRDEETKKKAETYFNLVEELISSWASVWDAAKQWLMALNIMHALYKAAYRGEVHEQILSPPSNTSTPADDGQTDEFRPQPGDGYPSLMSLPNLQACIKFTTGDTSARSIDIQSVWLHLSGGWPYGFTSPAFMMAQDAVGGGQVDYAALGGSSLADL